jgi:hypothetical protein
MIRCFITRTFAHFSVLLGHDYNMREMSNEWVKNAAQETWQDTVW